MKMSDKVFEEVFERVATNIAMDMVEDEEDVVLDQLQANWLESTDEYVVNFGDEVLFDGMTEEEAERLRDKLEDRVITIAEGMLGL